MRVRHTTTTTPGGRRRLGRATAAALLGSALALPTAVGASAADAVPPTVTLSAPSPACVATAADSATVMLTFDNAASAEDAWVDVEYEETPDRGVNEGSVHRVAAGQVDRLPITVTPGTSYRLVLRLLDRASDGTFTVIGDLGDETRSVPLCAPTPTVPTTPAQPTLPTSGTAQPVDAATLTEATRGTVTAPASAARGAAVTIDVGTALAGQQVDAWIYSTPTALGTRTVAADGTISVTIPSSLAAGRHRVAVLSSAGTLLGWDDLTVTAGTNAVPRAATGLDEGTAPVGGGLTAGLAVALLLPAAAIATRRRRTRPTA